MLWKGGEGRRLQLERGEKTTMLLTEKGTKEFRDILLFKFVALTRTVT